MLFCYAMGLSSLPPPHFDCIEKQNKTKQKSSNFFFPIQIFLVWILSEADWSLGKDLCVGNLFRCDLRKSKRSWGDQRGREKTKYVDGWISVMNNLDTIQLRIFWEIICIHFRIFSFLGEDIHCLLSSIGGELSLDYHFIKTCKLHLPTTRKQKQENKQTKQNKTREVQ